MKKKDLFNHISNFCDRVEIYMMSPNEKNTRSIRSWIAYFREMQYLETITKAKNKDSDPLWDFSSEQKQGDL